MPKTFLIRKRQGLRDVCVDGGGGETSMTSVGENKILAVPTDETDGSRYGNNIYLYLLHVNWFCVFVISNVTSECFLSISSQGEDG